MGSLKYTDLTKNKANSKKPMESSIISVYMLLQLKRLKTNLQIAYIQKNTNKARVNQ